MNRKVKNNMVFFGKVVLVGLIFVYLFYRASQNDAFEKLLTCQKNWSLLGLGLLFGGVATLTTMIRWCWLVRGLGVRLSTQEGLRIALIGYVFNLSPMGIVGGDLLKGFLLAKTSPDSKAACAVSVIADRVIGLYVMFWLGGIAILASGFYHQTAPVALIGTRAIGWLWLLSTGGILFLLVPNSPHAYRVKLIRRIPLAGNLFESLYNATTAYRKHPGLLLAAVAVTFVVHGLFAMSLWCFAVGIFGAAPSLGNHLVLYSMGNCGTLIPLSAGPLEVFLDLLYPLFPIVGHEPYRPGYGMMVGVAYRGSTILIAAVGGLYYLASRSEVRSALDGMEQDATSQKNTALQKDELPTDKKGVQPKGGGETQP